jgi:hypothetical protein
LVRGTPCCAEEKGENIVTRKLEELFGFPQAESPDDNITIDNAKQMIDASQEALKDMDSSIDKIELALPAVRGLESSDGEMDELAAMAVKEFNNLLDLGMNVDSRYASEIFGVASQMLGHAITAKNAKINKKLKIIELQLKKAKLDIDTGSDDNLPTAQGHVLDRNELLSRLLNKTDPDAPKS